MVPDTKPNTCSISFYRVSRSHPPFPTFFHFYPHLKAFGIKCGDIIFRDTREDINIVLLEQKIKNLKTLTEPFYREKQNLKIFNKRYKFCLEKMFLL